MPQITLETLINAPAEICFDLMRDVRIHTQTTSQTHEKAIAGVTEGMMGLGQTVTFEGTHLGFRQRLTVKVTAFERPTLFVDEMTDGNFKAFRHVHEFTEQDGKTRMRDTLTWTSPFGILGRVVDILVLKGHLRRLVSMRNAILKKLAEGANATDLSYSAPSRPRNRR